MTESRLQNAATLRRAAEQAASWYLDQREGLTPAQQAQFLAWLQQSPLHVAEYLAMAQMHGDLQAAASLDQLNQRELCELAKDDGKVVPLRAVPRHVPVSDNRPRRTWPWQIAMAACLLAVAAPVLFMHMPDPADVYASDASTIRQIDLADGTQMQLDRATVVEVRYDRHTRQLNVVRGGALFDVGHDPRPLRVSLGDNVLEDVGTVFDARHDDNGGSSVTVLSGRVRVWPKTMTFGVDQHALADLGGGERADLDGDGRLRGVEHHVDVAGATAWLPADIHFQNATVAEVARRFRAYGAPPLFINDVPLASTRISGRFHAHDFDAFIAYLRTLPGVIVQLDGDTVHVNRAAQPTRAKRL
ncbi:FecR family protein [Dyella sp. 20L07]|uniref:FecR family protein n=1 Tax=Dyella sp. 20L07 TaxID=3384240 RepID=UPI003D2A3F65